MHSTAPNYLDEYFIRDYNTRHLVLKVNKSLHLCIVSGRQKNAVLLFMKLHCLINAYLNFQTSSLEMMLIPNKNLAMENQLVILHPRIKLLYLKSIPFILCQHYKFA